MSRSFERFSQKVKKDIEKATKGSTQRYFLEKMLEEEKIKFETSSKKGGFSQKTKRDELEEARRKVSEEYASIKQTEIQNEGVEEPPESLSEEYEIEKEENLIYGATKYFKKTFNKLTQFFKDKYEFGFFANIDEAKEIKKTRKKRVEEMRGCLGESLSLMGEETSLVREHLEHLSLIPRRFLEKMRILGIRLKIGNGDVIDLSESDELRREAPRGWNQANWEGVPGCYDGIERMVYIGKGLHGSESFTLHEYGHGVGHLMGLNNSDKTIDAHIRLFKKLSSYYRQEGPGGIAGREEFVAESFASYFMLSEEQFIKRYDKEWREYLTDKINV